MGVPLLGYHLLDSFLRDALSICCISLFICYFLISQPFAPIFYLTNFFTKYLENSFVYRVVPILASFYFVNALVGWLKYEAEHYKDAI